MFDTYEISIKFALKAHQLRHCMHICSKFTIASNCGNCSNKDMKILKYGGDKSTAYRYRDR